MHKLFLGALVAAALICGVRIAVAVGIARFFDYKQQRSAGGPV